MYVAGVSSHPSLTTVNNSNNLSILYYNARSILPKHDKLRLVVEVNNPDIDMVELKHSQFRSRSPWLPGTQA